MSDSYTANRAAPFVFGGGQPSFVQDQAFTPSFAARMFVSGPRAPTLCQPTFIDREYFKPGPARFFSGIKRADWCQPAFVDRQYFKPGAAEMIFAGTTVTAACQPTFVNRERFFPLQGARIPFIAGQPRFSMPDTFKPDVAFMPFTPGVPTFLMQGGAQVFRPEGALMVLNAGQPNFDMRRPTPMRYDAPAAATMSFVGGQPVFVGGDRLKDAPKLVPFRWNATATLTEMYGKLASVKRFRDASEERRRLSAVPGGSIRFKIDTMSAQEAQILHALLYWQQDKPFLVPVWQYGCPLNADASLGSGVLHADFSSVPLFADGWVAIYTSPTSNEINLAYDFDGTSISLLYPTKAQRKAGRDLVVPAVVGYLSNEEQIDWDSLETSGATLEFTVPRWHP